MSITSGINRGIQRTLSNDSVDRTRKDLSRANETTLEKSLKSSNDLSTLHERNVLSSLVSDFVEDAQTVITPPGIDQPEKLSAKSVDSREIRRLTTAMMNRLWIPQTSTIVGLTLSFLVYAGTKRRQYSHMLTKFILTLVTTSAAHFYYSQKLEITG